MGSVEYVGDEFNINGLTEIVFDANSVYPERDRDFKYVGELRLGVPHGRGIMTYADGSVYRGQVDIATRPDGEGIWEFADGRRYEGQVKEGDLCGIGVMIFPDGTRQEGRFEKDQYVGPVEAP